MTNNIVKAVHRAYEYYARSVTADEVDEFYDGEESVRSELVKVASKGWIKAEMKRHAVDYVFSPVVKKQ